MNFPIILTSFCFNKLPQLILRKYMEQLPFKSDEAQVATTVELSEVEVGEDGGGTRRKAELG